MDYSFQCCIKNGLYLVETADVVKTKYANRPAEMVGPALKVLYSKDMVLKVQAKGICKGIKYLLGI